MLRGPSDASEVDASTGRLPLCNVNPGSPGDPGQLGRGSKENVACVFCWSTPGACWGQPAVCFAHLVRPGKHETRRITPARVPDAWRAKFLGTAGMPVDWLNWLMPFKALVGPLFLKLSQSSSDTLKIPVCFGGFPTENVQPQKEMPPFFLPGLLRWAVCLANRVAAFLGRGEGHICLRG